MPEQQLVEIAKAIGARARILILDEPTASLTDREVERLFRVIGTLRGEGAGIIYISHRLDEVAVIADRVTVLRDGQTIATRDLCDVDRGELVRLMVGRDIHAIFPKREVPIGDVALEVTRARLPCGGNPRCHVPGAARRNTGNRGPGRVGPYGTGGDVVRPDARRSAARFACRMPKHASGRPRRPSAGGSAICPKIAGSTGW